MQKTEFEKMRSSELYCFEDSQVWESIKRANTLCARFSALTLSSPDYREVVEQLIPGLPKSSMVTPPFRCDHGSGIVIGHDTFINYDCIMLDGGYITHRKPLQDRPALQLLHAAAPHRPRRAHAARRDLSAHHHWRQLLAGWRRDGVSGRHHRRPLHHSGRQCGGARHTV